MLKKKFSPGWPDTTPGTPGTSRLAPTTAQCQCAGHPLTGDTAQARRTRLVCVGPDARACQYAVHIGAIRNTHTIADYTSFSVFLLKKNERVYMCSMKEQGSSWFYTIRQDQNGKKNHSSSFDRATAKSSEDSFSQQNTDFCPKS